MPWSCCGQSVLDNEACPRCARRKRGHSLRLDHTRVFALGDPPFKGDGEAQAEALERASASGTALVEQCPTPSVAELVLVDRAGKPLAQVRVLVGLPDGREVEAWTTEAGLVRVRGLGEGQTASVRLAPALEVLEVRSGPLGEGR